MVDLFDTRADHSIRIHAKAVILAMPHFIAGATVIGLYLHHFGPGQGVTGVVLLAESHMSIHSWPEHGYAAIDIFLCGRRHDPAAALAVIAQRLGASRIVEQTIRRGAGISARTI